MAPGQDTTTRYSVLCSAASTAGLPNSSSSSSARARAEPSFSLLSLSEFLYFSPFFRLVLFASARVRHALRRLTGSLPPPHFRCISLRLSSVVPHLRTTLTHTLTLTSPHLFSFFLFSSSLLHFSTARFYTITQTHAHIEDIRTKITALESYFVYIYSLLPPFLSRSLSFFTQSQSCPCQSHRH